MDTGCGICRRRDAWDSSCDARERGRFSLRVSPWLAKREGEEASNETRLFSACSLLLRSRNLATLPRQIVRRTANTAWEWWICTLSAEGGGLRRRLKRNRSGVNIPSGLSLDGHGSRSRLTETCVFSLRQRYWNENISELIYAIFANLYFCEIWHDELFNPRVFLYPSLHKCINICQLNTI